MSTYIFAISGGIDEDSLAIRVTSVDGGYIIYQLFRREAENAGHYESKGRHIYNFHENKFTELKGGNNCRSIPGNKWGSTNFWKQKITNSKPI